MTLPPPPSLSDPRRERSKRIILNVVSSFVMVTAMVVGLWSAIAPLIP